MKSVTYNGVEYPSLKECVEKNATEGISYNAVYQRVKKGIDLHEAMTTPAHTTRETIYKGKKYPNLKALYEALEIEHISYQAFYARINLQNKSIDEAIASPSQIQTVFEEIIVDGVQYKSLKELGNAYGLNHDQLYARARRGWSLDEIAHGKKKKKKKKLPAKVNKREITIAGRTFSSKAEMCRQQGIKVITYIARVRAGWSEEEAAGFVEREDGRKSGNGTKYTVEGTEYKSIRVLSKKYNVNASTILARLKSGATVEAAVGLEPLPVKKIVNKVAKQPIVYNDVKYESITDFAKKFNISVSTLSKRLRKGMSPEEAISKNQDNKIVCHGKKFNSIMSLAEHYEQPYWKVRQRLKSGYTPEDAVQQGDMRTLFDEAIEINGVEYSSLMDACHATGKSPEAIKNRLAKGASIEQAFDDSWTSDPIIIDNQSFKNATHACAHFGVSQNAYRLRIEKGYSPKEALGLTGLNFANKGKYNESYFRRYPEEKESPSYLYLVEFTELTTGVIFQKIGVTKYTVTDRFKNYIDYSLKELTTLNISLYEACQLEEMIVEDLSQYQYTPNEKFEGRTECFQLPEAQIKAIIETVNSFNK